MDNLVGLPHEQGLKLLKDELYEKIKKFSLIDENDQSYYTDDIHSSYFDDEGVLSVICIIPKENHFTSWNKKIRVLSDDDLIITEIQTPSIQFVKGVGGEQVVKLTVSGEKAEIIYKANEYITQSEAKEIFLLPVVANTNSLLDLHDKLIEKGVITHG